MTRTSWQLRLNYYNKFWLLGGSSRDLGLECLD